MRRCLFEPEHIDYRESARRFVAEEVTPRQAQWEADGIVDRELFTTAAAKGMLAMQVPEQYGGAGVDDFRFNQIVGEELGAAGAGGSGLGLTLHNDICLPYFLTYCDEAQRERWLPGIARGELITRAVPAVTVSSVANHSARISASCDHSSLTVRSSAPWVLPISTHWRRLTRIAASVSPPSWA